MKNKVFLWFTLSFSGLSTQSLAQSEAGALFLTLPPGSRANAMGGAQTAVANDFYALHSILLGWLNWKKGSPVFITTSGLSGVTSHLRAWLSKRDMVNYQNIVIMPELAAVSDGDLLEWMRFGGYWGHPLSNPSAGEGLTEGLFDMTFNIVPLIPFGQPWLTIIAFAIWDAYVVEGVELIDDTKLAPIGPALRKDTYEKVYNQTGLNVYTNR